MGHFVGAAAAAAAHGVDKSTIMNRCETRPQEYQKITTSQEIVKPKKLPGDTHTRKPAQEPALHATRRTWPLTWYQYRMLDFDTRDSIWLDWCVTQQLDPELESTVDQFFDAMDLVQEVIA